MLHESEWEYALTQKDKTSELEMEIKIISDYSLRLKQAEIVCTKKKTWKSNIVK